MGVFQDADQFYECVGELMDRAKIDPKVGPKIAKSGIIIQFRYTEPEAMNRHSSAVAAKARDAPISGTDSVF